MRTAGIHHLGLTVPDVEVSAAFFRDALGFEVVKRRPEYPAVFVSDGTVMLTLWQADPDARPFDRRKAVGLHHVALRVPERDALRRYHDRLAARDDVTVDFAPCPLGPGEHCMLFVPGGLRVELVWVP